MNNNKSTNKIIGGILLVSLAVVWILIILYVLKDVAKKGLRSKKIDV